MSLQNASCDAAIVGGGVVGCAVARALAATGRRVIVVERGRPASEASWAAAGMLSPLGEAPEPGPFLRLALASMEAWPAFAAAVEAESGVDVDFRRDGKLLLAFDDAQADALARRRGWQEREGFDVDWLEGDEARALEPRVAAGVRAALHLPRDGQVDNRALGEALWRAAEGAGCRFVLGRAARGLLTEGDRVTGVRMADGGVVDAEHVVVAAGAWSGALGGLPRPTPLRPVRGQMLALATPSAVVGRVVAGPGAYLIPRGPGGGGHRVLVGATMEEVGFERGTTAGGLEGLRDAAVAAVPALRDAALVETWSGFRPATPDGLPLVGPDPEAAGLHWATGHFRNGILLAPATAERVVAGVEGHDRGDPAFSPDRFATAGSP